MLSILSSFFLACTYDSASGRKNHTRWPPLCISLSHTPLFVRACARGEQFFRGTLVTSLLRRELNSTHRKQSDRPVLICIAFCSFHIRQHLFYPHLQATDILCGPGGTWPSSCRSAHLGTLWLAAQEEAQAYARYLVLSWAQFV